MNILLLYLLNIFYLFLPLILGFAISLLTKNKMIYNDIIKPPLSPPKVIFPIAWTIIYILLGILLSNIVYFLILRICSFDFVTAPYHKNSLTFISLDERFFEYLT